MAWITHEVLQSLCNSQETMQIIHFGRGENRVVARTIYKEFLSLLGTYHARCGKKGWEDSNLIAIHEAEWLQAGPVAFSNLNSCMFWLMTFKSRYLSYRLKAIHSKLFQSDRGLRWMSVHLQGWMKTAPTHFQMPNLRCWCWCSSWACNKREICRCWNQSCCLPLWI